MAEVIEFRVPHGNGQSLLVLGVEEDASEASVIFLLKQIHLYACLSLQHALYLAFAAFGPLYSMKLHRNAPVAGPGYYALVKFYAARDARRAQCACNQKPLFQKSPLKVSMCTRQRAFPHQPLVLNSYKCRELANHYLGFNGWSSRIITLQNISGFEETENEEEQVRTSPRSQQSKYLCVQELTIPQYEIRTRGVGVAELQMDPNQGSLMAVHSLQKLAVQRALSDAFQKILLVVLENGKVTDLSLSDLTCEGEEEILSDLSIDEE
ncbi:hypothetical protein JD844_002293 [Phrynosoma platyrhinos]|uniref:DM1 domain-containing protein n=1 Tax=Phrynosoma platyrhinos TaxID=52577 RepID=A0ABQ7TBB7_PHRPL|nr:hypothetical protein JD844_002293 [Phrynosoma platyrhinos]